MRGAGLLWGCGVGMSGKEGPQKQVEGVLWPRGHDVTDRVKLCTCFRVVWNNRPKCAAPCMYVQHHLACSTRMGAWLNREDRTDALTSCPMHELPYLPVLLVLSSQTRLCKLCHRC